MGNELARKRADPKRVAYDLWCLQENQDRAGKPRLLLADLVATLRTRNPSLEDAVIDRAIQHMMDRLFATEKTQRALRQRLMHQEHRASTVARLAPPFRSSQTGRGQKQATGIVAVSNVCSTQDFRGYNVEKASASE